MSQHPVLEALDAAKGGPFRFIVDGQRYTVSDPADISWEDLLTILSSEHVPGTPRMSEAKRRELFHRWSAHHGLPAFTEARRLAYNVNRYYRTLENDLRIHARVDLGELWRARRWSLLLNAIDFLPSHSHYGEAVANDPEHAKMLIEALGERAKGADPGSEDDQSGHPPLHTWTPEHAALIRLIDVAKGIQWAIFASVPGNKQPPQAPAPEPRPKTVLDRARRQAEYDRKLAKHKALTARMLPHKAQEAD